MNESCGQVRVGFLMNSLDIPAWQYQMVRKIRASNFAEVVLVVINESHVNGRARPPWTPKLPYLLHMLYSFADSRLHQPEPSAFGNSNASELLAGVPIVKVKPRQTKFSDFIVDSDIDRIAAYKLDVLVRLGFRILRGKILSRDVAACGVWSHHHGDNLMNRGGPPGFWEVFEQHGTTGCVLQILNEDLDNGQILSRSFSATDKFSVARNRNNYYWQSASLVPRELKRLHDAGPKAYMKRAESANSRPVFYSRRLYKTPRNGEFAAIALRHFSRFAAFKLGKTFHIDQWGLVFDINPELRTSLWRFKRITPPKDRFWADPHVVSKDGKYYIFIEELMYAANRGHISVIVMDETGRYSPPVKVLERPYHLSYPFVFSFNGEFYMIPESAANRAIEVYRCVEFPYKWEYHGTLMKNVKAADTTLIQHEGKWWMFVNIAENEGASTWNELFLFSADSPLTDSWTMHPSSPLVSDPRKSRPAGSIFEHRGHLYRPSQDCSKWYGYGLRINRITKLTGTDYEEEEVSFIEPNWDKAIRGVHTLNRAGNLTVMDFIQRRRRWL